MLHEPPEASFGFAAEAPETIRLEIIDAAMAYRDTFRPHVGKGTQELARQRLFMAATVYERVTG